MPVDSLSRIITDSLSLYGNGFHETSAEITFGQSETQLVSCKIVRDMYKIIANYYLKDGMVGFMTTDYLREGSTKNTIFFLSMLKT